MDPSVAAGSAAAAGTPIADDVQYYEMIPNVIRASTASAFRVEVRLGRPVNRVSITNLSFLFSVSTLDLVDDGSLEDRVAGDDVYTSDHMSITPSYLPFIRDSYLTYGHSDTSVTGMNFVSWGQIAIEETNATSDTFLIQPEVGILSTGVVPCAVQFLSTNVQVATHLANVMTAGESRAQHGIHIFGANRLPDVTVPAYAVLPDDFDFIVLFSTMHGEKTPRLTSANFNAGVHYKVQSNYEGTGQSGTYDNSAFYGSSGRLLSINIADSALRGTTINNVLHEITHQWAAFVSFGLGIKGDGSHWEPRSNVGSILGGFEWLDNGDGTYSINPEQGRSAVRTMAPLDQYLAGLRPSNEVSEIMVYDAASPPPTIKAMNGEPVTPEEIVTVVGMDEIIALHGPRVPGPDEAQTHFNVLFIAESSDRFLNAEEMTLYNTLAREFERLLAPTNPAPLLSHAWQPATRYFGGGATLASRVTGFDSDADGLYDDWERTYFGDLTAGPDDDPDQDAAGNRTEQYFAGHPLAAGSPLPLEFSIDHGAGTARLEYTCYLPGESYVLEESTNLATWGEAGFALDVLGPHVRVRPALTGLPGRGNYRVRVVP